MKVAANLATMFTEVNLLQRYELAAEVGFKLVEVPFPYSVPAVDLKAAADRHSLNHALINAPVGDFEAGERGLAAIPGRADEFRESIQAALEYAKTLNCPRIHVMTGYCRNSDDRQAAREMLIENLKYASSVFEKEAITVLIEPINGYSMPGYFLDSVDLAVDVIGQVGSRSVKLLFDVFHVQQMHGQLTGLVKKHSDKIGHVQVAQVPHRHEPDSPGEVDYRYVFDLLKAVEKSCGSSRPWIVGCEYINTTGTTKTVDWVSKYGLGF